MWIGSSSRPTSNASACANSGLSANPARHSFAALFQKSSSSFSSSSSSSPRQALKPADEDEDEEKDDDFPQTMSQPQTAITPRRDEDFPEWYQQVVRAADLAETSDVRGCMVIKPWGYGLWENMQRGLDGMFKATG